MPAPGQSQPASRTDAAATRPAPATCPCEGSPLAIVWRDGPAVDFGDDKGWLKLGIIMQSDFGLIDAHGLAQQMKTNLHNAVQWRRVRPYVSGEFLGNLRFKLEADFTEFTPVLTDAYIQVADLPAVGTLTVGHFKEPFSLEQLTPSSSITFLERALIDAFAPGWNFGAGFSNTAFDQRVTWAAGVFQNIDRTWTAGGGQGNATAFTGRATFLPWYEREGADLLHLGAAYSLRFPQTPVTFSQRPEAHFVANFTDTKSIDADRVHLFGAEAAWVKGPFSLQGEYAGALAAQDKGNDVLAFTGGYVQASWFLTGEHRPYDRKTGIFTRVRPRKDFLAKGGGLGAWELAGRYSFIDLAQPGLPTTARDMQDITAGLNWYLTPYLRVSWNYVRSWVAGPGVAGAADIFVMRLQLAL